MPTFPTQEGARRGGFVVIGAIHVPLCHTGGWQHPSPRGMTLVGR